MRTTRLIFPGFILLGSIALAASYPETPEHPVTEEYHGVKVTDPYRWLEDASNPEVQRWTQAQANYARAYLDRLPLRTKIRERLLKWNEFKSPTYRALDYRGGTYFALKLDPPKNQPMLVALESPDKPKSERVVVDPNAFDSSGTTAIDFFVPSLDGKRVAVSLSKGGSEVGALHVYDTTTSKEIGDPIPAVNKPTGGGSVGWNADGSGFYYTRYPAPGERPKEDEDFYQQIWFHGLGTSEKDDRYSLGKDFPRIAEIHLETSDDGKFVLATVANGDGGEFAHYVLGPDGQWTQITRFQDKATAGKLGLHGELYLVSLLDSPRGKVLKIDLSEPALSKAKTVVKEGEGVIDEVLPTQNRLYVSDLVGGPQDLRAFDLDGKALGQVPVPPLSSVAGLTRAVGDTVLFGSQSYVEPLAWYRYDKALQKTGLAAKSPVSFKDIEVTRELATSKDGTRVPMTVLYKKGTKRDGKNPAILWGYGGYSISIIPRFSADTHLWLEHGGVYAIANLRGGGEFGESWHHAGNLTHKQNVFDDFIACAEQLIRAKYTSSDKLAAEGGSNGGLLMGAALTQRPDLFRAVVSHVGIYDMLRVENDPNGAFNVTEFGTVKDPDQFKALYGYSPYHHVVKGTRYPSALLLTGANDGRVNPYHSKKMAARLQASSASGNPALLRVTFNAGHGIGRSVAQKVDEETDVDAFLFARLGMTK